MKVRSGNIRSPEVPKASWMTSRKDVKRRLYGTASTKRLSGSGKTTHWEHPVEGSARQLDVLVLPAQGFLGVYSGNFRAVNGSQRKPSAIFLTRKMSLKDLRKSIDLYDLLVLPTIDYSGENDTWADFSLSKSKPAANEEVLAQAGEMNARLKLIEQTDRTMQTALLARIYVRDKKLAPVYDPLNKSLIAFKEEHLLSKVQKIAEDCVRVGLLERHFFNRIHACPSCNSSRLNVREECGHCRSADLEELSVIHHFRCGYIGPESDFGNEDKLKCPKCRKRLKHFSIDYDRPGSIMECNGCGHSSKVTEVGFECADCGTHNDTEVVHTRSYHSYSLSAEGEKFLQELPDVLQDHPTTEEAPSFEHEHFRDHDVLRFITVLNSYKRMASEAERQFCLVQLTFGKREELLKVQGRRAVRQIEKLFLHSLRENIDESSRAYLINERFFIVSSSCNSTDIEHEISEMSRSIVSKLNHDPAVKIKKVDMRDAVSTLLETIND